MKQSESCVIAVTKLLHEHGALPDLYSQFSQISLGALEIRSHPVFIEPSRFQCILQGWSRSKRSGIVLGLCIGRALPQDWYVPPSCLANFSWFGYFDSNFHLEIHWKHRDLPFPSLKFQDEFSRWHPENSHELSKDAVFLSPHKIGTFVSRWKWRWDQCYRQLSTRMSAEFGVGVRNLQDLAIQRNWKRSPGLKLIVLLNSPNEITMSCKVEVLRVRWLVNWVPNPEFE